MQIGRKIYYDKSTGDIIQDTGERSGSVVETTQAEDFEMYVALADRVPDSVGCLQLEYGQDQESFMRCSGCRVDPETLKVVFLFSDPQEPDEPPVYQQTLSQTVADQGQRLADVELALADIFAANGGAA